MAKKAEVNEEVASQASELASALRDAIEAAKPPTKKTVADRKVNSPWTPKGTPKIKLKRKIFQHGMPISEQFLKNEQIELCNKLRPGLYCDGYIKVVRRRDKGLDIDYPVKSNTQRMKLATEYGVRSFTELLQTCIKEAENPRKSEFDIDE